MSDLDIREYYHVDAPVDNSVEELRALVSSLNKHLTDISVRLGNMRGTLDEDAFTSNSDEYTATQQSIKAYVDDTTAHHFHNVYYPDRNAADQGAANTVHTSVKTIVDDVGTTDEATIIFRHNSGDATTTYTFGTAETIPANIKCVFEQGARFSGASNVTFNHEDPIDAPRVTIFDDQVNNLPYAHVEWFGADPSGVSDSRNAFDRAHDSIRNEGTYYALGEDYALTGTTALSITNGKSFEGKGHESTRLNISTNAMNVFSIEGQYTTLRGFSIDSDDTPTSGTCIYCGNTGSKGHSTNIEDVQLNRPYRGIHLDVTADACSIRHVTILDNVEHGIHINGEVPYVDGTDTCSDITMDHVLVNAGSQSAGEVGLYLYDSVEAVIAEGCSFLNGEYGLQCDAASYTYREVPGFCRFTDCFFDSNGKQGALLTKCNDTEFNGSWFASGNTGAGFDGVTLIEGNGVGFIGCTFLNCGSHGINVGGDAKNTRIIGCEAVGNSVTKGANVSHGIAFDDDVEQFQIIGNSCHNIAGKFGTQGYGILVVAAGTADNFIIAGNECSGNGTGGLSVGNYSASISQIVVHNNPQPTNSKGHFGAWVTDSGTENTGGVKTLKTDTATTDLIVHAYLEMEGSGTRAYLYGQTPTGTTRTFDSAHFDTTNADSPRVAYCGITMAVRGGDTWGIYANIGAVGTAVNWYTRVVPVH